MSTLPFTALRRARTFLAAAFIAVFLCALFLGAGSSVAQAQTFRDVRPSDWFYPAVEALVAEGAVGGYADGTFRPYEPVTRAQFAVMIAGVLHLEPGDSSVFRDVSPGDWFAGAVGALHREGIVQGAGGSYLPAREITRQQAASVAMRGLAYRLALEPPPSPPGEEPPGEGDEPPPSDDPRPMLMTDPAEAGPWLQAFRDRGSIAAAHTLSVANAFRAGVIVGFADQRFYPFIDLTRGQAAGILFRSLLLPLTMGDAPPAAVTAEAAYPTLRRGASGAMVAWMERRLSALSYRPGAVDGLFDAATGDAIMAFQKVQKLERSGTATDTVQRRLIGAAAPSPRRSVTGSRAEIDLTRQVLFVIKNNRVDWTIPVATGAQGWRTPTGTFSIQRKLPYWRESYLGMLYKPAYFYGGYAIHGSHSVPPYPASHGCVRVAVSTMDGLYPLLPVGMRVDIYY